MNTDTFLLGPRVLELLGNDGGGLDLPNGDTEIPLAVGYRYSIQFLFQDLSSGTITPLIYIEDTPFPFPTTTDGEAEELSLSVSGKTVFGFSFHATGSKLILSGDGFAEGDSIMVVICPERI